LLFQRQYLLYVQDFSLSVLVATERLGSFRTSRLKLGSSQCSLTSLVPRISRRQLNDGRGANRTRYGKFATLPEGVWKGPERPCQRSWRQMLRLAITSPVLRLRNVAKEEHSDDALLRPGHVIADTKFVSPVDLRSPRLVRTARRNTNQCG
jgi:hypothetical protein